MIQLPARALDVLKEIPPLLPQFLRKRRVGLPAVEEIAAELGLERALLFTLMRIYEVQAMHGGNPVTLAQLRARDPYRAIDGYSGPVGVLKENGLLDEDEHGALALSPEARAAVERLHTAARAYVAQHRPLPPDDLRTLAEQLERAVDGIKADPVLAPRPGSHLAGALFLEVPRGGASEMVRIEQAVFDLWMARDDAHIKAWRDAGLEGPAMDVLWLLWQGKAGTVPELQEALRFDQTPEDVESSLAFLADKGYIAQDGDEVGLTPAGVLAREDIEHETDRIYFAPWPPFSLAEATWLRDKLCELVENLGEPGKPGS